MEEFLETLIKKQINFKIEYDISTNCAKINNQKL